MSEIIQQFQNDGTDLLQFDDLYGLTLQPDYLSQFGFHLSKSKKKFKSKQELEELLVQSIKDNTSKLIGEDRIALLEVFIVKKDTLDQSPEKPRKFVIGVSLGAHFGEPVTRGPPANKPEGREFRENFGELSEIRKFADNALCETVTWLQVDPNGFPAKSENVLRPLAQRWLEFILYKKLFIPPNSLRRLIRCPKHWQSLVPRAQLPPTLVPLAYAKLGRIFREIQELPLQIVGVNCVSGHLRDTEPIHLGIAPTILKELSKAPVKKLDMNNIPPFLPTVDVFITLERNGKWGKNPVQLAAYKLIFYHTLALQLAQQYSLVSVAEKAGLVVMLEGVVFRVQLVHDAELDQQRALAEEFDTTLARHAFTHNAHAAVTAQKLQAVAQTYAAFGEATQLAKRFLASAKLSNHLDPLAVEMIVATGFQKPIRRPVEALAPMSALSGFLQFLHTLAHHDFVQQPLFVDLNENFTDETKRDLLAEFQKRRPVLPCICLICPEDRAGVRFTTKQPEPIVMSRLVGLARRKYQSLINLLQNGQAVDLQSAFDTPTSIYDLRVQLHPDRATRFLRTSPYATLCAARPPTRTPGRTTAALPVLDFHPSRQLVRLFEEHHGARALFFMDDFETDVLHVTLRPSFRATRPDLTMSSSAQRIRTGPTTVEPNLHALAEDLFILGQGLVFNVAQLNGDVLVGPKMEESPEFVSIRLPEKRKTKETGKPAKKRKAKEELAA